MNYEMDTEELILRVKLFVNLISRYSHGSICYDPFRREDDEQLVNEVVQRIRILLNRANSWIISKISAEEETVKYSIQFDTVDNENKYGVIESLKDLRNISKLQYVVAFRHDLYFTPYFLKYFDHSYCADIEYLKILTKF